MRRKTSLVPAVAPARLWLWALLGLTAHAGAAQLTVAAPDTPRPEVSQPTPARCAGSACPAAVTEAAWPYRPGGEDAADPRASRRVRIISLDAVPSSR